MTEFFSYEQCFEGLKFTLQFILLDYSRPYWLSLGNASDCTLFEDVGSDVLNLIPKCLNLLINWLWKLKTLLYFDNQAFKSVNLQFPFPKLFFGFIFTFSLENTADQIKQSCSALCIINRCSNKIL